MFSPISRLKGRHFPLLAAESQRAQREPEESHAFVSGMEKWAFSPLCGWGRSEEAPLSPAGSGHPSARHLASTLPPLRDQQREQPLETAVLPVFN